MNATLHFLHENHLAHQSPTAPSCWRRPKKPCATEHSQSAISAPQLLEFEAVDAENTLGRMVEWGAESRPQRGFGRTRLCEMSLLRHLALRCVGAGRVARHAR